VGTKLLRGLLKELQAGLEQRTPLGIGQPGDIAGLAFLAGEEGFGRAAGAMVQLQLKQLRCGGGADGGGGISQR
jgi:hypothetical protein